MYNESYEDYIRSILGYPSNPNIYNNDNLMYKNYSNWENDSLNAELEQFYPDIYNNIYPKIQEKCLKNTNPINRTLIDNMVNDIYNLVDVSRFNNTSVQENRGDRVDGRRIPPPPPQSNNFLKDLIRILILRELTGRPGGRPPQPRPPFGMVS